MSFDVMLARAEEVLAKSFEDKGARPLARPRTHKGPAKVREASFEDYSQITDVQIRNGLASRSCTEWMALWKGNPVYEQLKGGWPIGWVLETDDGDIVGSIDNVPCGYHLRGRELCAAAACSWAVDPAYRSYSMLLLDRLTTQKGVDFALSTTVSSNSEPALKFFKWSLVPVGKWHKSAFWITNYPGFVQSVLSMKSVPLARLISYPVSTALFCWDMLKDTGMRVNGSAADVELCSGFDSRFDRFWDELKTENDGVLLAVRNQETLSWHFRYALMRRNTWILTVSNGSRLVAYGIFDRQDNAAFGLKRVRLVDFQALNGSEKALLPMLCWMLKVCREEGVHILENVGCWLDRPGLPPIRAPYYRTLHSSMYYYKAGDPALSETLKVPAVWAPSSFDGDVSL
jgi:hypothetical protein